jgi:hypothetical protein
MVVMLQTLSPEMEPMDTLPVLQALQPTSLVVVEVVDIHRHTHPVPAGLVVVEMVAMA